MPWNAGNTLTSEPSRKHLRWLLAAQHIPDKDGPRSSFTSQTSQDMSCVEGVVRVMPSQPMIYQECELTLSAIRRTTACCRLGPSLVRRGFIVQKTTAALDQERDDT